MDTIKFTTISFSTTSKFLIAGITAIKQSIPVRKAERGITIGLLLPFLFVIGISALPGQVLAEGAEARAEALTHSLVALNARYANSKSLTQKELLEQLIETAFERQEALGELLQDKPATAMKYALPAHVIGKMPDSVRQYLEHKIEIEGSLEALYEDYRDGSHKLMYFLKSNGKRYSVHINTPADEIRPGKPARFSGILFGNTSVADDNNTDGKLLISAGEDNIQYLAPDENTSSTQGGVLGEPVKPLGEQRTLVLLVNFQDSAGETPFTLQQAHDSVFGTVNDYFVEASYGKTWLTGEVRGWYTLPIDSSCDGGTIATAANAAASADGIDLSIYDRFIYIRVGSTTCFYNGASTLFRYPSEAYIDGGIYPPIIAHELGHGLGLGHSRLLDCGDTVLGSDCTFPIADQFDMMGYSQDPGHFNAFQKERLGWFSPGEIITINGDGVYELEPIELADTTAPKVFKILQQHDPEGQGSTWYYLEYRQALGFDSFIAGNSNVLNGILLHTGADYDYDSSLLLDMTPNSSSLSIIDVNDPALVVGESFTDVAAGITVSTNQADASRSSISVSLGQPDCVHNPPLVELSPAESPWVAPGTSVTYSITVTNTDSQACSMTDLDLSAIAPAGWNVVMEDGSLQIAAGANGSTGMTVTSPTTATEGFHEITVTAGHSGDPTISTSTIATYVIEPAGPTCTTAAPLLSLSPSSQSATAGSTLEYTLFVTNQNDSACQPSTYTLEHSIPTGWSGSLSASTMTLVPGDSGSATISISSPAGVVAGNYAVAVDVGDATHTSTGNASYTVVEDCTVATPGLVLSPSSQNGDPGSTLLYTVTLTNNDSAACSTTDFDLTITYLPGGWNGSLSPTSLVVAPGTTGTATLSVTSSDTAEAAEYNLQVAASDTHEAAHALTVTAGYGVNDTSAVEDTQPPTTPEGLTAGTHPNHVNLSWYPSTDNIGVEGYRVWRNGVVIADIPDTSFSDGNLADNVTYEYAIDAYDAKANVSGKSNPVTAGKAKAKGKGGGKGKGANK